MQEARRRWPAVLAAAGLAAAVAGCGSTSSAGSQPAAGASSAKGGSAQAAAAFYRGKTLTIVVPYGAGGGYDQWARLLSPYLQKYLGLARVVIVNQPGGGGLVGTNQVYHAKPDGLTIGDTNAGGDVFDQIAHDPGAQFDVLKFDWIGQPDNDPHVMSLSAASPYHTFADLLNAKKTHTVVRALGTGQGSSDYNAALITLNGFGIPYRMIAAYQGSTQEKAGFLRGDGDIISVSASDIAPLVQAKHAIPVLVESDQPFSKLPNVPTITSEAKKVGLPASTIQAFVGLSGVMNLGHAFFAPPGVPADRLQALRQAFEQAVNNPEFQAQAAKAGLYVGYASPSQLSTWAKDGVDASSELAKLLVNHSQ